MNRELKLCFIEKLQNFTILFKSEMCFHGCFLCTSWMDGYFTHKDNNWTANCIHTFHLPTEIKNCCKTTAINLVFHTSANHRRLCFKEVALIWLLRILCFLKVWSDSVDLCRKCMTVSHFSVSHLHMILTYDVQCMSSRTQIFSNSDYLLQLQ